MKYGNLELYYVSSEEDLVNIGNHLHFPYIHFRAAGDDETNLLVWNILLAEIHPNVLIVDTREHAASPIEEQDDL